MRFPQQLGLGLFTPIRRQGLTQKVFPRAPRIANMLIILKDGIEAVQASGGQQPQGSNHIRGGAGCKCASRVADEDNLIAINIVGADEVVRLANDLLQTRAKHAAGDAVEDVTAADAGVVGDDLVHAC